MRRNVIEAIQGIEIFPLIALVIFFGFFIIMLYWVYGLDKSYIKSAEDMPLDDEKELTETYQSVPNREGN